MGLLIIIAASGVLCPLLDMVLGPRTWLPREIGPPPRRLPWGARLRVLEHSAFSGLLLGLYLFMVALFVSDGISQMSRETLCKTAFLFAVVTPGFGFWAYICLKDARLVLRAFQVGEPVVVPQLELTLPPGVRVYGHTSCAVSYSFAGHEVHGEISIDAWDVPIRARAGDAEGLVLLVDPASLEGPLLLTRLLLRG